VVCSQRVASNRQIAVAMARQKKDDPPFCFSGPGRPCTEDRQDDAQTDCFAGWEAGCISGLVRRLLWSAGASGVTAGVCERAVVRPKAENGRRHCPSIPQGSTNLTTFSRIDQVGRVQAPRPLPTDRGRRACPSGGDWDDRRVGCGQERQRDGRSGPAMVR
jgi:hypothetical protein